jgi:large subunit ribosomal protein L3
MKRHNFKGQPASHGNGQTERRQGSIGQSGMSKVFKGKKMAGRMGGKRVTTQKLLVQDIDVERNLIYLKGAVPGNKGGYVEISDTKKWPKEQREFTPIISYYDTAAEAAEGGGDDTADEDHAAAEAQA